MKSDGSVLLNAIKFCASLFIGTFGIVLICAWPVIFEVLLILKPNSLVYNYWKKVPFDVQTDIYLFNWTNSEDVYNLSVKPRFEEVGPYRFWQKEEKVNLSWNDNGTVTYRQQRFWHYEDTEKNGNLDDMVITGNAMSIVASYTARTWNYYIRKGAFITLAKTGLLTTTITQKVRNLLFEGYREPLIRIAAAMPFYAHLNIPQWDRFSLFYERNGSIDFDGVFEMGTAKNSTLGKIYSWNYQTRTPYFEGVCADVSGSAGELYFRNPRKDWISLFSSDVRRSVTLRFVGEETVNGLLGYKYTGGEYMMDNGTMFPENKCFCNGECVPSGAMNISSTRFGSPIFISLPHFHKADPYYNSLVDGMKSNSSKHEFYIVVEPTTGIPLKAQGAIQFNFLVQPVAGTQLWEAVPKFFLPVAWVFQTFEMPKYDAFLIKMLINTSTICIFFGSLMIVTGVALTLSVIYKMHVAPRAKKEHSLEEQGVPLKKDFKEKD